MNPEILVEYEFVTGLLAEPMRMLEVDLVPESMISDPPLRVLYEHVRRRGGYASPTLCLADLNATERGRKAVRDISQALGNRDDHAKTVNELFADGVSISPVEQLCEQIREAGLRRASRKLIETTRPEDFATATEYTHQLSAKLSELSVRSARVSKNAMERGIDKFLADWEFKQANPGKTAGWKVNLGDYDHLMGGLRSGEITLIAGSSHAGKSQLLLHMFLEAALTPSDKTGKQPQVALFSVEMGEQQVIQRLASKMSGFNADSDTLTPDEKRVVQASLSDLRQMTRDNRLRLVEPYDCQSYEQITREMMRLKNQGQLDIVFIDYLQIVRMATATANRYEMFSEITGGFKRLALQLDIPVVLATQLNREAWKETPSGEPFEHHIAESQGIYNASDNIHAVWVPEKRLGAENAEMWRRIAVVKTLKARTKAIPDWMYFLAEYDKTTFTPVSNDMKRLLDSPQARAVLQRKR